MTRTAKAILRGVAFILVFILGFISCVGAIVGAGFYVYSSLSLDTLKGFGVEINTDDLLDPDAEISLSAMTIQKLVEEVQYLMTIGEEADLDLLIERYGLKLPEEVEGAIPDEIRGIPLAQMFSENGINAILENTEVDYILALIPDGIITEPTKAALSGKTLDAVVELRLGYLLSGVKLGYLTGVAYELDGDGNYQVKYANPDQPSLFELVAPLDLGELLDSITGESGENMFDVITDAVGDVMLETLVGSIIADFPLSGILGDTTISDLIVFDDESGEYYLDLFAVLDNRAIGDLLGYYHDEADGKWYVTEGGEPVDAILASVCGILVSDLIDPGVDPETGEPRTQIDILLEATGGLQLGSIMGYQFGDSDNDGDEEWYKISGGTCVYPSGIEKALLDISMGDVLGDDPINAAFGSIYVGELLGYTREENSAYDPTDPESKEYIWVDATGNEVDAIYAALADYTVADLVNGNFSIDEALSSIYIGDFLGYTREENSEYDPTDPKSKEYIWVDSTGNEVDAIYAALADYTVADLMNGNFSIEDTMGAIYIGDFLGYTREENSEYDPADPESKEYIWVDAAGNEVDAIYAALADYTIADLMNGNFSIDDALSSIYLGDLLGYTLEENSAYDPTDPESKEYIWVDGSGNEVDALYAALADYTIADLMNGNFSIDDALSSIYLGDLLGYTREENSEYDPTDPESKEYIWVDTAGNEVASIYATLADYTVADLMNGNFSLDDAFAEVYLGELMGYTREENSGYDPTDPDSKQFIWVDDSGNEVDKIYAALADYTVSSLMNGDLSIEDALGSVYLGELMGYERVSNPTHDPNNSESKEFIWVDENGNEVTSLFAKLADYTVSSIMNGDLSTDAILAGMSLADVLELRRLEGVEIYLQGASIDKTLLDKDITVWVDSEGNKANNIMNAFAHLNVDNIAAGIDELNIGDLCGLVKYNGAWYSWSYEAANNRVLLVPDNSIATDLAHITLKQFAENNFEGEIRSIKLGRFLGYTLGTDGKWYNGETLVEGGIMSAFVNLTLNDLSSDSAIKNAMKDIQIAEVLGFKKNSAGVWEDESGNAITGIIAVFADLSIDDLSSNDAIKAAMQDIQIAEVLGYKKNSAGEWEDENGNPISGIIAVFAGLTLDDLSSDSAIKAAMQDIQIAEVVGYKKNSAGEWEDENGNPISGIIAVFAGLTLDDLSSDSAIKAAMQDVQIAELLGYTVVETTEGGKTVYKYYNGEVKEENLVTGIITVFAGLSIDDLGSDAAIKSALQGIQIAEVLGFKKNSAGEWEDANGKPIGGIISVFANLTLDDLSNDSTVKSAIQDIEIAEVLGLGKDPETGEWVADGIMREIAGWKVGELNSKINGMKIGQIAGYTYDENSKQWLDKNKNPATGIMAELAGCTVSEINDKIDTLKVGQIVGYTYDENTKQWLDEDNNPPTGIMHEIADCKITELNAKIKTLKLGEIAGYTYDYENNVWLNQPAGILGALKDLTMEDLTDESQLSAQIRTLKVADVLGYVKDGNGNWFDSLGNPVTGVMAVMADSHFSDINQKLNDALIGHILGYELTSDGYWLDGGVRVSGFMNAVANTAFSELDSLYSRLTIADIIPERDGFLSLVDENTTLENIGTEIDKVFTESKIGVLVEKGIINLDNETCLKLDALIGDEWRNKPLPDAIQYIVNELLNKINSFPFPQ